MKKLSFLFFVLLSFQFIISCDNKSTTNANKPKDNITKLDPNATPVIGSTSIINFDPIMSGSSATIKIPISYNGTMDFTINNYQLQGPEFTVTSDKCKIDIAKKQLIIPVGGCDLSVSFNPVTDTPENITGSIAIGYKSIILTAITKSSTGKLPAKMVMVDLGTAIYSINSKKNEFDVEGINPEIILTIKNEKNTAETFMIITRKYFVATQVKAIGTSSTAVDSCIDNTGKFKSIASGDSCRVRIALHTSLLEEDDPQNGITIQPMNVKNTQDDLGTDYMLFVNFIKVLEVTKKPDDQNVNEIDVKFADTKQGETAPIAFGKVLGIVSPDEQKAINDGIEIYKSTIQFKEGFFTDFKINQDLTTCKYIKAEPDIFQTVEVKPCILIIDFKPLTRVNAQTSIETHEERGLIGAPLTSDIPIFFVGQGI